MDLKTLQKSLAGEPVLNKIHFSLPKAKSKFRHSVVGLVVEESVAAQDKEKKHAITLDDLDKIPDLKQHNKMLLANLLIIDRNSSALNDCIGTSEHSLDRDLIKIHDLKKLRR